MFKRIMRAIGALSLLSIGPVAQAQWAVVDVGAIGQLIQQVSTLKQQLDTAQSHLAQAQQQYQSLTGGRGMEKLLSGIQRNYLPSDWAALSQTLSDLSSTYAGLSSQMRRAVDENAVLTPEQLASMSPAAQAGIERERRIAAMDRVTTRDALSTASQRFASIQQLIDAIKQANDAKGVLDLQARIGAEQAMLQNEQTKLRMLHQSLEAEEAARKLRVREQAIADIGSFRHLPPMEMPPVEN